MNYRPIDAILGNQNPWDFLAHNKPNAIATGTIPTDIYKDNDSIIIEVELAGVKKDDIEIDYIDGAIIIKLNKELGARKEGVEVLASHRMGGTATLNFKFRETEFDFSKIEADFTDGLLTIKAPIAKPASSESHKIELK